jgi:hypothetical protein
MPRSIQGSLRGRGGDLEVDQGFGLGNSFGIAGYVSGDAYKLGRTDRYHRMAGAIFRQTIASAARPRN